MTFSELEKWIVTFITKIYHKRIHSSLDMSPEEKFLDGILHGSGTGLPAKPDNPQSIYLDFLPSFHRTIQRNGVNIDGLNYYDSVLRPFIHAKDIQNKKKRQFTFKRDPKNITEVWFYHEDEHTYYRIPSADQSIEHLTLHEYHALKKLAKSKRDNMPGRVDEREVLMAYEELHSHADTSKKKTKKARRMRERKEVAKQQYEGKLAIPSSLEEVMAPEEQDLWSDLDAIPEFDVE